MFVVKYRRIFFAITTAVVIASLSAVAVFGLKFGIEFTGGEILTVSYEERPEKSVVARELEAIEIGTFSLRAAGTNEYILRTKPLSDMQRERVFGVMERAGGSVVRFNAVGPTIGNELRNKAWVALIVVVLAIVLFIAFAFRKVSEPVASWKYGVIAIVALLHDIIVPVGVFAVLGHFFGSEINVLFVMALLAILGYSVNDTIVVFDRVRENVRENEKRNRREDFELTVGKSLNQTYVRSINTSLTTLFVLLALFFIGAEVTQDFALVLIAGVLAGTYSSIFLATPLLVTVQKWGSA